MPELRKRKAAPPASATAAKKVKSTTNASAPVPSSSSAGRQKLSKQVEVGQHINPESLDGEIRTNDDEATSLKSLLTASDAGVVIFTYPKASTPGCTTQACLFRDSYNELSASGFAIYGLSRDSPKSNTTFRTKQNLPFTLLCDPKAVLISTIGMQKPPNKTSRGVIVISKDGKVLTLHQAGPAATLEAVQALFAAQNSITR